MTQRGIRSLKQSEEIMSNRLTTTKLAVSAFLMTAALAGCAGSGAGPVATGPTALGNYLDQTENRQLTDATQQAAEQSKTGERVQWENKDGKTGLVAAVGWVEPKSESYVAANGEVCRDLNQSVVKSGERHIQSVKACHGATFADQPTSVWVIQQS
jgi:surface antigen